MSVKIIKDGYNIAIYHNGVLVDIDEAKGPHGYKLTDHETGKFVGWLNKFDCDLLDFMVETIDKQKERDKEREQWKKKPTS